MARKKAMSVPGLMDRISRVRRIDVARAAQTLVLDTVYLLALDDPYAERLLGALP